jgi:hypothetical protein
MSIQKAAFIVALALGLIVGGLITASCLGPATLSLTPQAGNVSDPNSVMWRFQRGFMNSGDLPSGWSHRRAAVEDRLGGIGRLVTYYGDNPDRQPLVNVNQTIAIFPSDSEADAAFHAEVPKYIPPADASKWKHPTELRTPRQADEAEFGCLPSTINSAQAICVVLTRYGDMVMVLTGQVFEARWMTMSQFALLIDRIDEHMQSARMP